MRRFYVVFLLLTVGIILLIAASFIILEKEKHVKFYYLVNEDSKNTGFVRIDKYKTEDSIIYRSATHYPKNALWKTARQKMVFKKPDFILDRYKVEKENFGVKTEAIYLTRKGLYYDFLSIKQSKFSTIKNLPFLKKASIFDVSNLLTYFPFVDMYDFLKGGAQSFNAIFIPGYLMPPAKGKIVLMSIRDEYIKVGSKKIKTECVVVKSKIFPEARLWISKRNHNIVKLSIEEKDLYIKMVHGRPEFSHIEEPSALNMDVLNYVMFPSQNVALAGTLMLPKDSRDKIPCVLFVGGSLPLDRNELGLFSSIADYLAENGFASLAYDKRGMGKSQGDFFSVSIQDELVDVESALQFLFLQPNIDKKNIVVIAHSDAASYIAKIDLLKYPVKGVIFLSPIEDKGIFNINCYTISSIIDNFTKPDSRYAEIVHKLIKDTTDVVKNSRMERVLISGKSIYVTRMRESSDADIVKDLEGFNIPFLIITGKKDEYGSQLITKKLKEYYKNLPHRTINFYNFRQLGHFLGKLENGMTFTKYYEVDKEVLQTILGWLKNLTKPDVYDKLEVIQND